MDDVKFRSGVLDGTEKLVLFAVPSQIPAPAYLIAPSGMATPTVAGVLRSLNRLGLVQSITHLNAPNEYRKTALGCDVANFLTGKGIE